MKKFGLVSTSIGLLVVSTACADTFDDIQLWAGSGTNEAAIEIDWNSGTSDESLLWGYRWDGTATGLDMFEAVVTADPRLYAYLGSFSFGTSVIGIGYDANGNGVFGVSPTLNFDSNGLLIVSGDTGTFDDSRTATDSGDLYLEGWNSAFWDYYTKSSPSDTWTSSLVGAGDRTLSDGNLDAWVFAPGFSDSGPSNPAIAPVPEPTTIALCAIGAGFVIARRFGLSKRA